MARQPNVPVNDIDPWLVDNPGGEVTFEVPLALDNPSEHLAELGKIAEEHPELIPQPTVEPNPSIVFPQPIVEPIETETEAEEFQVEGGTVILEKTGSGWKATLKGARTEVFKGKTKNEVLVSALAGKLKATQQIDKLNKKLKLGRVVDAPLPVPAQPQVIQSKVLSADDVFQLKTALAENPDLALESWFQKKYGRTLEQLLSMVEQASRDSKLGVEASQELTVEGVSKEFLSANEDYYVCPENSANIMYWLCVHKLRRQPTTLDNFGSISGELATKGLYTVENLQEAFDDLKEDELITFAPDEEDDIPVPTPPVQPVRTVQPVTQQTPNPRIAVTRTPRGGLGIRPGSVSNPVNEPIQDRAPSVDDLENLSNEQLEQLKAQTDRYRFNQKYGRR